MLHPRLRASALLLSRWVPVNPALVMVLALALAPFASRAEAAAGRPSVLCTIPPVYALVSALGAGVFEVNQLVPSGTSPHDYQPSPADVRRIAGADLVVLNGLGLDDWLHRLLKSAQSDGKRTATATLAEGLDARLLKLPETEHDHAGHDHDHHHHHGDDDPHVWLDPTLLAEAATNLTRSLVKLAPASADILTANRDRCVQLLHALDGRLETTLGPVRDKPFLTQHNGFAYFVRRYRLNLAGVLETKAEVSPSAKELGALLRSARQKKALAVLSDEHSSQRLADQVAKDLKLKKGSLDTLETMKGGLDAYAAAMSRNAGVLASLLKD